MSHINSIYYLPLPIYLYLFIATLTLRSGKQWLSGTNASNFLIVSCQGDASLKALVF